MFPDRISYASDDIGSGSKKLEFMYIGLVLLIQTKNQKANQKVFSQNKMLCKFISVLAVAAICTGQTLEMTETGRFFLVDSFQHKLVHSQDGKRMLVVEITVANKTKKYSLDVLKDLYSPNSKVHFGGDDHERVVHGNTDAVHTYEAFLENDVYILGTLFPNGGVHLHFNTNEGMYQVGHHSYFRRELGDAKFRRRLQNKEDFDLIPQLDEPYFARDMPEEIDTCGDEFEDGEIPDGDGFDDIPRGLDATEDDDKTRTLMEETKTQIMASLRELGEKTLRELVVKKRDKYAFWPNCYPDDTEMHVADIGIVTTKSFWIHNNRSYHETRAFIENMVAYASRHWELQFNIKLNILHLRMGGDDHPKDWDDMFAWANEDSTCPRSTRPIYDHFYHWVKGLPEKDRASHWHLVHKCSNTIAGWARSNTFCKYDGGSAIVRSGFPRTFAHEIGHAMGGMRHSDENGIYQTGGFMSYGSSRLPGTSVSRYNPLTRRSEACREFKKAVERTNCFGKYFRLAPDSDRNKGRHTAVPTTIGTTLRPTPVPNTPAPVVPTYQTSRPVFFPTKRPQYYPTKRPTTHEPTPYPVVTPTKIPTAPSPKTSSPTQFPTKYPTTQPPTNYPSKSPSRRPSRKPTQSPTAYPTSGPTNYPTTRPTNFPTTAHPTVYPTTYPTYSPTGPTRHPTRRPTNSPFEKPLDDHPVYSSRHPRKKCIMEANDHIKTSWSPTESDCFRECTLTPNCNFFYYRKQDRLCKRFWRCREERTSTYSLFKKTEILAKYARNGVECKGVTSFSTIPSTDASGCLSQCARSPRGCDWFQMNGEECLLFKGNCKQTPSGSDKALYNRKQVMQEDSDSPIPDNRLRPTKFPTIAPTPKWAASLDTSIAQGYYCRIWTSGRPLRELQTTDVVKCLEACVGKTGCLHVSMIYDYGKCMLYGDRCDKYEDPNRVLLSMRTFLDSIAFKNQECDSTVGAQLGTRQVENERACMDYCEGTSGCKKFQMTERTCTLFNEECWLRKRIGTRVFDLESLLQQADA